MAATSSKNSQKTTIQNNSKLKSDPKSKESKSNPSTKVTEMAKKKAPAKNSKAAQAKVTPVEELLNENEHLKNAVQQIEKQFGDGSIMTLGSDTNS